MEAAHPAQSDNAWTKGAIARKKIGVGSTTRQPGEDDSDDSDSDCSKVSEQSSSDDEDDDDMERDEEEEGEKGSEKGENDDEGEVEGKEDQSQSTRPPKTQRGPKRLKPTTAKPPDKKGKAVTGTHREPSSKLAHYRSRLYTQYNIDNPQTLPIKVTEPFKSFEQYNDYLLYCNPDLTDWNDIPKHGVRVDDLTIMRLYKWEVKFSELHKNWPADFDQQGMVRATRVPLGYAAKIWKEKGERDLDNKPINQAGWYYIWYADIHQLPGDEGFKQYTIRPSHEKRNKEGLTGTKMSSWASIQDGPGKWQG